MLYVAHSPLCIINPTDLEIIQFQRGNLQTRLRKLDAPAGNYTALILASAGLIRLGLASRITSSVISPTLYHAVGQGAIGVEIRTGDARASELIGSLEDWKTGWTTRAERSMLRVLEGGCSVPVGCETYLEEMGPPANCPASSASFAPSSSRSSPHAHPSHPHSATLSITGTITSLAGTSHVQASLTRAIHSIAEAEALGAEIAQELIMNGGRAILEELGKHVKEVGGEEGQELPFESNYGIVPGMTREANMYKVKPRTFSEGTRERTVFLNSEACMRPEGW
jgi:hydroxymethylbilane synthase